MKNKKINAKGDDISNVKWTYCVVNLLCKPPRTPVMTCNKLIDDFSALTLETVA